MGILYHKINNMRYLSKENTRRTPYSSKALMRDEFKSTYTPMYCLFKIASLSYCNPTDPYIFRKVVISTLT